MAVAALLFPLTLFPLQNNKGRYKFLKKIDKSLGHKTILKSN